MLVAEQLVEQAVELPVGAPHPATPSSDQARRGEHGGQTKAERHQLLPPGHHAATSDVMLAGG
jgi:hypothetical protein